MPGGGGAGGHPPTHFRELGEGAWYGVPPNFHCKVVLYIL